MPLRINGVEAWITGDNKVELEQYDVELDGSTDTATCWISGEPGETFAIRWRELAGRDISGFVTMDGYELGGRVLQASSHAPALFSRVATSPTSCLPLAFSDLPRTAGIGENWVTLGTVIIDIHEVQIGEARLHGGFYSHYRNTATPPSLASATPFSSTEVESLQKIATLVFKYRPMEILRYHHIAPVTSQVHSSMSWPLSPGPNLGEKRRISLIEDTTSDEDEEENCGRIFECADAVEELRKMRPRIALRTSHGSPVKRMKF